MQLNHAAPDFSLFNTEKKKITLSELKGKNVVLLFFPLAFTSTCTAELCSMRDNLPTYNGLNAEVFGISVDSLFSLGKFKEEQKLNFDLLSDFNKTASKDYKTIYDTFVCEMRGVSKRSAFVIDKKGVLKYIEVLENAGEIPNFDAILRVLKDIK
ncbi:MAG: redoxin domain-containing protein [Bacteroidia bacterium]